MAKVREFFDRYGMAMLGGLLLASSFPRLSFSGAAWVAPAVILFAAGRVRGGDRFRIGYVAGLVHYLVSLYWLLFIPFPVGAITGWIALSLYLALYPAVWVWFCWWILGGGRDTNSSFGALLMERSWASRAGWLVLCAAAWVALEMVVAHLFTGFPWNLLGTSQYRLLPLIQIAAITGVYGVSFLIVWFSLALGVALLLLVRSPQSRWLWIREMFLPFMAVMSVLAFGLSELNKSSKSEATVSVALVQPSIPQTLIWDPAQNEIRFKQLLELSEKALNSEPAPEILIWPEASVPTLLRYNEDIYDAITGLASRHKLWMIIGADDAELRRTTPEPGDADYFNSSFLISPAGELVESYRKRHLVIFGEYIPFARLFPFVQGLLPIGQGFERGTAPVPFHLPELGVTTSVLICFEDNLPHLVREYVEPDTDFLLNLTNNGWFGESAAQWQHAANALFRAVENRIPLVRCTNNGLTCWIDSHGRLHNVYFEGSQDVYQAGFKRVDIPILRGGKERQFTFYHRHGDLFGWGCFWFSLLWFVAAVGTRHIHRRRAEALAGTSG